MPVDRALPAQIDGRSQHSRNRIRLARATSKSANPPGTTRVSAGIILPIDLETVGAAVEGGRRVIVAHLRLEAGDIPAAI